MQKCSRLLGFWTKPRGHKKSFFKSTRLRVFGSLGLRVFVSSRLRVFVSSHLRVFACLPFLFIGNMFFLQSTDARSRKLERQVRTNWLWDWTAQDVKGSLVKKFDGWPSIATRNPEISIVARKQFFRCKKKGSAQHPRSVDDPNTCPQISASFRTSLVLNACVRKWFVKFPYPLLDLLTRNLPRLLHEPYATSKNNTSLFHFGFSFAKIFRSTQRRFNDISTSYIWDNRKNKTFLVTFTLHRILRKTTQTIVWCHLWDVT